jgi:hypothetical protein
MMRFRCALSHVRATGWIKQTGTHNRSENGSSAWVALYAHTIHNDTDTNTEVWGRAMAQAVSSRPLTAESWVRARVNPSEICSG